HRLAPSANGEVPHVWRSTGFTRVERDAVAARPSCCGQKAREGRETLAAVTRNHEARGAGVEARRHTARHRVGSMLGGGADAGTWFIDPCTARTALPAAAATPVPIAAHTHQGAFDGVIAASRRAARFSRTSGSSPGSWRVPRVLVAPSPPPSSRAQSSSLLATASGWGGST